MDKREVRFDGQRYKVRSDKVAIPDLKSMSRLAALSWLIAHTYATGYSRPSPLTGLGGAVSVVSRSLGK